MIAGEFVYRYRRAFTGCILAPMNKNGSVSRTSNVSSYRARFCVNGNGGFNYNGTDSEPPLMNLNTLESFLFRNKAHHRYGDFLE